jgi:hypothetical protein
MPGTDLNILQSQILCIRSARTPKPRRLARHKAKDALNGRDRRVHIQVDMICADPVRQIFGSATRLVRRVRCAHVAGVKDAAAEFTSVCRDVGGPVWLVRHSASIGNDLFICS